MSERARDSLRQNVEQALLAALRTQHPGKRITIHWNKNNTIAHRTPTSTHEDRSEHAA